eukprot:CAMPEP_0173445532 /NCGR_PEP_ID=MMETSP1357-20121228/34553_1 /TAXON_ID=77926 /ORGANISM="Hemiselmis rufescens, Strain PCC563" /LENGTH=93 /DNA_ID=CAMNT_0014411723 /DNA_START=174 /DNA_END=451 /DNA_ORIENTATION=+
MTGIVMGALTTGGSVVSTRASATLPVIPTLTSSRSSIAGPGGLASLILGNTTPRRLPGLVAEASNDDSDDLTLSYDLSGSDASNPSRGYAVVS